MIIILNFLPYKLIVCLKSIRLGQLVLKNLGLTFLLYSKSYRTTRELGEIKEKDESGRTIIKIREFPKTETSMNAIELSESAYIVFNTIKKLIFKMRAFDKKIRRICNAIGIKPRSMHKLGKTYASILFANGVEEKITQQHLRHKDSRVTHQYYEFSVRTRGYKREQLNQADIFKIPTTMTASR